MFLALGVILKVILVLSETVKYMGGKSTNKPIHSLLNFEFINPYRAKFILVVRQFIMVCPFNIQKRYVF